MSRRGEERAHRRDADRAAREAIRRASMLGRPLEHGGVIVIVPTVAGREEDLARTKAAYEAEPGVRMIAKYGQLAVGEGWRDGVQMALDLLEQPPTLEHVPEFVMLGNDDMPPLPGWLAPAIEAIDAGFTPCPVIWTEKGGLLGLESAGRWGVYTADEAIVDWAPMAMFRLDEWRHLGEMPPLHYYSDNWFSDASLYRLGRPLQLRRGFQFTHTWAEPGRRSLDGPEGRQHQAIYRRELAAMRNAGRAPRKRPVTGRQVRAA